MSTWSWCRHRASEPAQRSTTRDAVRDADRAHRLNADDRPQEHRHLVQPVHAVVDDRTDARAVERARIAGVFAPGRGTRVGVMGEDERRPAIAPGPDQLVEPLHPTRRRLARSRQERDAGRPGRLDQAIRLGDRRGERLLGVERDARCEDRLVDHAMGWRGSEIDDPVEPAGLEHRVERVERACVGRPARDLPGQRLRASRRVSMTETIRTRAASGSSAGR